MKVVRWFGCIGMALSSPAFYYIPQHFGHNFAMALLPAIALGIFVAAFVPLAAVFPALEPKHKGAAISVYNLSAGMSNFLAPAIAVILLPFFSTIGVVIAYTALYVAAFSSVRLFASSSRVLPTRKRRPASRWSSLIGDAAGMPGMPALMRWMMSIQAVILTWMA